MSGNLVWLIQHKRTRGTSNDNFLPVGYFQHIVLQKNTYRLGLLNNFINIL